MAYLGGAGARRRPRWAPPGRQAAGFSAGCRFGGLAGSARFGQAHNNVNKAPGRPPKLPGAWCPPPATLVAYVQHQGGPKAIWGRVVGGALRQNSAAGGGGSAPTRAAPAGPGPFLGLSLPPRWLRLG